jgi:hypothetical protein
VTASGALAELVEPAFHSAPDYGFTLGPEIGQFCADVGYAPDPEQQLILNDIFAEDEQQRPEVFATAVIGPRRNIKTGVEIQAAIGWLYVLEVPGVQYSAHKWKTALGTFETMSEIIRNSDDLSRRMLKPMRGTGYCKLRLKSSAEMDFATRTLAGGRGEETDKQIFDEALKLRRQHTSSLIPAMATRPLAQLVYGSSACLADSEVLREIVDRGRAGTDPRLSYTEYCAPRPGELIRPGRPETVCDLGIECTHRRGTPGCGLDKAEVIAIANSQYGRRIAPSFFTDMRGELSPDDYGREVLGWHDAPLLKAADRPPLDLERWQTALDEEPDNAPERMPAFAIEVDPDQSYATIDAAGRRGDGRVHLEFVDGMRGIRWVVPRCVELAAEHGPAVFAVDGGGPAADLIPDLKEAGLDVLVLGTKDIAQACADLTSAVNEDAEVPAIAHGPQPELDDAVEAARKRPCGGDGAFAFRRSIEALPILAAAEAKFALEHGTPEVAIFGADLDVCDGCGDKPHEDPHGEHDYLCVDCRPDTDDEED